ncbi:ParB/RepB/Spo0J family partition protein [Alphaproteobacteria bacterium endosymbiont of Tiliacea citrago]|uniref:ParB/RepB/Spo0J family partition protein n=1 Tax=Alphaproteobacteria bacterium endosymbiont of Tiliacea citrago TaxID=3077944 RepID=UPI00313B6CE5
MEKDNKRLGLGLDALFGSEKESKEDFVEKISIDLIQIAKWQPRKIFEEEGLLELSASIKEYGVLQPIILRKLEDHYEIIAGERRFRASKMAGLHFIPAIIVDFDDKKSLEVSMIENLQRKDLSPIEKAEGFEFLIEKLKMTQEELSEKLGFSRSYITNFLRLNGLSDKIKEKIQSGKISVGHAKVLANKKNSEELAKKIIEEKLTVRQLEDLIVTTSKPTSHSEEIKKFEQMLLESLNAKKVEILISKNAGKIIIDFENLENLDEIISKIYF